MATSFFHQYPLLLLALLAIPFLPHLFVATAAEVGYGPGFDPCGDNCQTQMVAFCTVGHNAAQMRTCWCDGLEYINRMDACLDSCDPAVSNKSQQRDQMLRYRSFVCEPTATSKDTQFSEYYRTRFASVDGGFIPAVTRGIPPPTASPRALFTMSISESMASAFSSESVASVPSESVAPTFSGESVASAFSSGNVDSTFLSESMASTLSSESDPSYTSPSPVTTFSTTTKPTVTTITITAPTTTAAASPLITALPSTAAGPTLFRTGLTTLQLACIIIGVAVVSVLLSLSTVYCIRQRNPRRPIWDPPPPPPLPRPSPVSFLPYYHPTSPPPAVLSDNNQDLEPHAITTSTASIYSSRGSDSIVSPSRERGRYTYFPRESPIPSPAQSEFQKYLKPPPPKSPSTIRILTPVVTPTQSTIQITSASAIAAATAAAEAAERSMRNSTHTVIELEPQQVVLQGIMVGQSRSRNRSRSRSASRPRGSGRSRRDTTGEESEFCEEDDCTASCSSWSERSWYEEDDDWWDLRESQVMGPSA